MEIGIGLDRTLGLSLADEAELSAEAARLGYASIWTPEGPGYDSFQLCLHRWAATRSAVPGGLSTGISVSPVALRTPFSLAMSAGTASALTEGRFVLGIGSGAIHTAGGRRAYAFPDVGVITAMREYVTAVRALVAGEEVTRDGPVFTLNRASLDISPPPATPIYLGSLGPQMVRLAGEVADGTALNWCTPEQVAWSRQRVAEGAEAAGRDPGAVKLAEYIRVCVDDDVEAARLALAKAALGYAMGPRRSAGEKPMGYRAHFERMGFAAELAELDRMRDRGCGMDELAADCPEEMLKRVGYFGKAEGAAAAIRRLAEGLDVAIVRVVVATPGVSSVLATMRAGRPGLVCV